MDIKELLPIAALVVAIGGAGVTYGIMQSRIEFQVDQTADLEAELARAKEILHRRISTNTAEISALQKQAMERVTDVEVKITKLDSKIDRYNGEAQATMARILERLQKDIGR